MGNVIMYSCGCIERIDIFNANKERVADTYCSNETSCIRKDQRGLEQTRVENPSTDTPPVEDKGKDKK